MSNHYDKTPEPRDPNYLSALEKHFPRIVDKIVLMWATEEFPEFLNGMMIDKRGDRQGFPLEVLEEMMFLTTLHDNRYGERSMATSKDYRIA
ncbi:MAG: hypothetical protein ABIP64_09500 [Burkholderiales bacterium]